MTSQSETSEIKTVKPVIELSNHLKKKNRHRHIKKTDVFLAKNMRCAIRVSGRLYNTCRLYCVYSLFVEKNSLLYRALKYDNPYVYFKYDYKNVSEEGTYYETVERVQKNHFKHKKKAFEFAENLKLQCQDGRFDITSGHYSIVFKDLYKFKYCRAESALSIGQNKRMLEDMPDLVELKEPQTEDSKRIRKMILNILGAERGGIGVRLTAYLDIQPFKYYEAPIEFFFVDCAKFFLEWEVHEGDHTKYYSNDVCMDYTFLFMKTSKSKIKCLTYYIGKYSLKNFAEKKWDSFSLDTKTFFKTITTQDLIKISNKQSLGEHVKPGSILRVNDDKIAVCLNNGDVIEVLPKRERVNNGPIYVKEKLDNFIGNHSEVREIKFAINRFKIDELEARAGMIDEKKDPIVYQDGSCEQNAMYLVTGLKVSVTPGKFKKMFRKLSHKSVHV